MNLIKPVFAQGNENGRKLIVTAESKSGKAYVRIIGRITDWNSNNSKDFQKQVDELVKVHDDCEVYINSQGGSVFEAAEINNQLKRFKNVSVRVGSLAASAATYFIACYPTTASLNSQLMIHKPSISISGNEDQIQADLKLLKNVTKDYLAKYSKKTGKTTAEIEELWKSGDYWMSATEAKADGFIDFIDDEAEAVMTSEDISILEACGAPIIPKPNSENQGKTDNNSKTQIMDREELIAFLGLSADATDEQIESAKRAMKVDALKQRSQEEANNLKTKNEAEAKAEKLVDDAITAKKLTADQKETWLGLAKADFEGTEKALNALQSKEKLSAHLTPADGSNDASRAKWTLEDYLEKDPEAYEKLKVDKPKEAEALEAAYFAKQ